LFLFFGYRELIGILQSFYQWLICVSIILLDVWNDFEYVVFSPFIDLICVPWICRSSRFLSVSFAFASASLWSVDAAN